MQVQSFVFNPFMENTYVLYDATKEAVIIDPGCHESYEQEQLTTFVKEKGLSITSIVNTHGHIDHVLGNVFAKEYWQVPIAHPRADREVYESVKSYAAAYGFPTYKEAVIDRWLEEGDLVTFGDTSLAVVHTPGHAPGHMILHHAEEAIVIGGDVLFREGIGRTDLPGGDHDTLLRSIREKLFVLPENTRVYPGHGESTTIGHEKKHNPFCT